LNIKDRLKKDFILDKIEDEKIKGIIENNNINIDDIIYILDDIYKKTEDIKLRKSLKKSKLNIYR
jgi:hypothetical protein